MMSAIIHLHDVSCILFFVLRYLVLGFDTLTIGACGLVRGHCSFHHGVDLFERQVGIRVYLPEPVKLSIVDK